MAARTILRALSRCSSSKPRPAVAACNYLRERSHSVPGLILGTRIIHSETFPHRCGPSCAEKCAAGSLEPYDHTNGAANIFRCCFSSTVKTSDSKPKQEDHSASIPEEEDDSASELEEEYNSEEDDWASDPEEEYHSEEDDSASQSDEENTSASKPEEEDDLASDDEPDAEKGTRRPVKNESDATRRAYRRTLSPKEVQEADEIGYRVIGSANRSDAATWRQKPIFAVVQIGSHQFKVSGGDRIYIEKLKFADVKQKIILNKVLMLGTKSETVIGRPILPDAAVHAVVEEQALGAETIIFKKKRRKNYRRTNYHRQELTRLKIVGVEGLEKPVVAKAVTA